MGKILLCGFLMSFSSLSFADWEYEKHTWSKIKESGVIQKLVKNPANDEFNIFYNKKKYDTVVSWAESFNYTTFNTIKAFPERWNSSIQDSSYNIDGTLVSVYDAGLNSIIVRKSPNLSELVHSFKVVSKVVHMEFSPDSRFLLALQKNRSLKVWDLLTGRELYKMENNYPNNTNSYIFRAKFTRDSKRLIIHYYDSDSEKLLSLNTRNFKKKFRKKITIGHMAILDNYIVVSSMGFGSMNTRVLIIDVNNGRVVNDIRLYLYGDYSIVEGISSIPDQNKVSMFINSTSGFYFGLVSVEALLKLKYPDDIFSAFNLRTGIELPAINPNFSNNVGISNLYVPNILSSLDGKTISFHLRYNYLHSPGSILYIHNRCYTYDLHRPENLPLETNDCREVVPINGGRVLEITDSHHVYIHKSR